MRLLAGWKSRRTGRRRLSASRLRTRRAWAVEALEGRALLTTATSWAPMGPSPIINGQSATPSVPGVGSNIVVGAIESVAPEPGNADTVYVGTVNGGIWKTTDATDPNPTWVPETDQMPSMTIADIEFSPLDSSHQTLYAATGDYQYSSGFGGSPSGAGIYKTTDGGATWVDLGESAFDGLRLRNVVPTGLTVGGQEVVLAAVRDTNAGSDGVWRSVDGGVNWSRISANGTSGLPGGGVSFLTGDPGDVNRFYAAIPGQGVYTSDDGGVNWASINTGLSDPGHSISATSANRIELADASYAGGPPTDVLYAALMKNGGTNAFIFRSTDQGATWTEMAVPGDADGGIFPGGQDDLHFAMVADPGNANVVFVSGDRAPNNLPAADGSTNFTGRVFRGDASQPLGSQWTAVVANGAHGTSPHADSRDMKFDANGDILQTNDGGIYRLVSPDSPGNREWVSVNGDLQISEVYSVAYDDVLHTAVIGAQDVGSAQQDTQGAPVWDTVQQGDGGVTAVDTVTHPGETLHYTEYVYAQGLLYEVFNSGGGFVGFHFVGLKVSNQGGADLRNIAALAFIQPYELSHTDPSHFLINSYAYYDSANVLQSGHLYDSNDQGDTLFQDGDNVGQPYSVYGYDYGGQYRGVSNPDIAYAGYFAPGSGTGGMLLHTSYHGNFNTIATYPGFVPKAVIMDPQNDHRVFDIDYDGHIYASFNMGASWVDLTGNLGNLTNTFDLRTIQIISPTASPADDFLMVGGEGGVFAVRHPGMAGTTPVWAPLGTGLSNAIVTDLKYDPVDDLVLAATFGRGVWTFTDPTGAGGGIPGVGGQSTTPAPEPAPPPVLGTLPPVASSTIRLTGSGPKGTPGVMPPNGPGTIRLADSGFRASSVPGTSAPVAPSNNILGLVIDPASASDESPWTKPRTGRN